MHFNEYLAEVNKTWMPNQTAQQELDHCEFSLGEEVGEIQGVYKKHFGYGRSKDEKWHTKFVEECGDLIYYITKTADLYGINISTQYLEGHWKLIETYDMDCDNVREILGDMISRCSDILNPQLSKTSKGTILPFVLTNLIILIKSEGHTLDEIQIANIAKLQGVRHKNGFNQDAVYTRDKEAELKAIENSKK